MELRPGLSRVAALDVEATRRQASEAGYVTFVLPADGVVDRASFFYAVRATLPLDPRVVGSRSWDALSDSLWEGLHALPHQRIAIMWPSARTMARAAPSDFEMALKVLTEVATSLADPGAVAGKPKEVALVVESGASGGP